MVEVGGLGMGTEVGTEGRERASRGSGSGGVVGLGGWEVGGAGVEEPAVGLGVGVGVERERDLKRAARSETELGGDAAGARAAAFEGPPDRFGWRLSLLSTAEGLGFLRSDCVGLGWFPSSEWSKISQSSLAGPSTGLRP